MSKSLKSVHSHLLHFLKHTHNGRAVNKDAEKETKLKKDKKEVPKTGELLKLPHQQLPYPFLQHLLKKGRVTPKQEEIYTNAY